VNAKIFRQTSLDRLSSPEQLDQLLVITSPHAWCALGASLLLLLAVCVWGFTGRITTTAAATGVIVRQGGVLNVVTNGGGVVTSIAVKPGSPVEARQVIAIIDQPALDQQLALLQRARDEAIMNRDHSFHSDTEAAQLKGASNERAKTNLLAKIGELQERAGLLKEQVEVEQQLFSKGLVTNQQVLDMKQRLVELNDEVATENAQLIQLDAEKFTITAQPEQQKVEWQMKVTDLDRQIASANERINIASHVVSPYDGEVLELKVSPGSTVAEGEPIVSIQPQRQNLEVLAYIPSLSSKDLRVGMDAEISPSNVKREEYGFMRGHVDYVADFPATDAAMMRNFENKILVQSLAESGPVTEIRATLTPNSTTRTGFAWSTSAGPAMAVTSGTICRMDVVTRREKPISLVFPFLRAKLGY
jgi:HlyD family secretion protein